MLPHLALSIVLSITAYVHGNRLSDTNLLCTLTHLLHSYYLTVFVGNEYHDMNRNKKASWHECPFNIEALRILSGVLNGVIGKDISTTVMYTVKAKQGSLLHEPKHHLYANRC